MSTLVFFFDTMLSCLIYSNLSLFEHKQINYQTKNPCFAVYISCAFLTHTYLFNVYVY
jgi:hypothetical protein